MKLLYLYFAAINILSIAVTVSDKRRAKKHKRRIRERTLFLFAFLGGSLSMYVTMRLIRHKTLHKSFMLGLPAIMILQAVVSIGIYLLFTRYAV